MEGNLRGHIKLTNGARPRSVGVQSRAILRRRNVFIFDHRPSNDFEMLGFKWGEFGEFLVIWDLISGAWGEGHFLALFEGGMSWCRD